MPRGGDGGATARPRTGMFRNRGRHARWMGVEGLTSSGVCEVANDWIVWGLEGGWGRWFRRGRAVAPLATGGGHRQFS